jgi:hypothetical protein
MARAPRPPTAIRLAAILAALPLAARPAAAQGVTACLFEGWSAVADPEGAPVRARPDPAAPVVGRLPPPADSGVDRVAVTVTVTAHRDGWFRIAEASFSEEAGDAAGPVDVAGWVPADAVKAQLAGRDLRAAPAPSAPLAGLLTGFRREGRLTVLYGPEGVGVRRLLACRGSWVEADTEVGRGWVERVCARQLGPCE